MSKFNFKKVNGQRSYKGWKEWSIGDFVVGSFEEEGEDKYGKPNYIINILESTFEGENFQEGKTICLNSCGSLDHAMKKAAIGNVIQVEYMGQVMLEKGTYAGTLCHTVEVGIAASEEVIPGVSKPSDDL